MSRSDQSNKALRQRTVFGLLVAMSVFVCYETVKAYNQGGTLVPAQDAATELRLGDPVSREIRGGGFASFKISAPAQSYFQIVVEQQGSALSTELFDPQGNSLVKFESVSGAHGPIYLSEVAKTVGYYRLEIRSRESWALPGRYELRLNVRSPEAADEDRIAGERAFAAGQYLISRAREQSGNEARQSRLSAIDKFKEAAQRWHAQADPHGEAISLYMIGVTYQTGLNQAPEAKRFLLEALTLAPLLAPNDWRLEASVWNDLGVVQDNLYDEKAAQIALENALKIFDAHQDRRGRASVHNNLGLLYLKLGQSPEAIKAFLVALPIRQAENDRANELITLNNIGGAYDRLGEPREALTYYEKALQGWRDRNDKSQIPIGLNNVARASDTLGSWQSALTYYQEAIALARKQGLRRIEATFLYNSGDLYNRLNEPARALENHQAALLIHRELKNPRDEANVLAHMAQIYLMTGQAEQAQENYAQAMQILDANKNIDTRRVQAYTLIGMASAYLTQDPNRALEYCLRARNLSQETGDRQQEADALEKMGEAYSALNKKEEALASLNGALLHRRTLEDRFGVASTLYQIANLKRDLGQLSEAAELSEELLGIVESLRGSLVSQQSRANYFAKTQSFYELHIDLMMQLNRTGDQRAEALLTNERRRARGLVDSLVESGRDIRKGVSSVLLSQVQDNEEQLRSKDRLRQQLINEIDVHQKTLERQRTSEQLRRDSELKQRLATVSRDIRALIAESDEIQTRIKLASPGYANLKNPPALSVIEIQQLLLDDNTALLEYSLGDKRSYVWVVTREGIQSAELQGRDKVETAAQRLLTALTARGLRKKNETVDQRDMRIMRAEADYAAASSELAKILIEPITSFLNKRRLAIVADGGLQLVPFAVLPLSTNSPSAQMASSAPLNSKSSSATGAGTVPVIAEHEIVYLPSASVLAVQRQELAKRQPAAHAVAVLANPVFGLDDDRVSRAMKKKPIEGSDVTTQTQPPPVNYAAGTNTSRNLKNALRDLGIDQLSRLPYSYDEAFAIMNVVPKSEYFAALGFEANRATALSPALSKYRYIHFATHGILNLEHPELSGIVLSLVDKNGMPQDGYLFLNDIYNLNLPAELVVLSACQTGVGKQVKGEGLMALTRGFMYAGAARLVASLWKVDDAATANLMAQFYKEMFTNGKKPAAALQSAQLHLRKQRRWSSPAYWAGFFIQGEWR